MEHRGTTTTDAFCNALRFAARSGSPADADVAAAGVRVSLRQSGTIAVAVAEG